MKFLIALASLALVSTAHAATFNGAFKVSGFQTVPASLTFTSGRVSINAPGASCVPTFGTTTFAGHFPDNSLFGSHGYYEVYNLPVINSCGAPRSFRYTLVFLRSPNGDLESVNLKGSTGRSHWTYFYTGR